VTETRFLFNVPGAQRRVMHIAAFDRAGNMLDKALCGRRGFNRSINAPWGLGRPRCKDCLRELNRV